MKKFLVGAILVFGLIIVIMLVFAIAVTIAFYLSFGGEKVGKGTTGVFKSNSRHNK